MTAGGGNEFPAECGAHSVAMWLGLAGSPVRAFCIMTSGETASDVGAVGGVEEWLEFMSVVVYGQWR